MQDTFIIGAKNIEQKLKNLTLQSENDVSGEKVYEDPETRTSWLMRTIHPQGDLEDFKVLARLNAQAAAEMATLLVNGEALKVRVAAAHYLADLDRQQAFTALHRALRISYGSTAQWEGERKTWEMLFREMGSSIDNFISFESLSAEQQEWNKAFFN